VSRNTKKRRKRSRDKMNPRRKMRINVINGKGQ
jgi:hypothetical protein